MSKSIIALDTPFDYFNSIFQNSIKNNIIITDKNGSVLDINSAFSKCFGYQPGDVKGKYISMFFTEDDIKKGKPETEIQRVLSKGQASDDNYFVSKNGGVTWVSGESVLVRNESGEPRIVKIIQDINQQKKSEQQVSNLNELNRKILASLEDAVAVLDKDLNILNANSSFYSLFKVSEPSGSPINLTDVLQAYDFSGDLIKSIREIFIKQKVNSKLSIDMGTTSLNKRSFEINCAMMTYDGELNLLVHIHDVTIHKELEREREDVVGFVAHELRNPLANLVLCNDLLGELIRENNTEEIDEILTRSKNNVWRLNKLVAELYESAKVSSGNLKLDVSTFNFERMIAEAIDTVKILYPEFDIIVSGNGNIEVTGDRHRLMQVVTNYLTNGIKYSDGQKDVVLHMSCDTDDVTVLVKDNGLGIAPEFLPHIFDRFFRAEKTRNMEGIGLGLYLCQQIINAHRGKVWAESEEGKGSIFYFSIPIRATA
jgi:PAS domain S-box-containing protein